MERYPIQCCSVGSVVLLYFSDCIGNIIVHYIGDETLSWQGFCKGGSKVGDGSQNQPQRVF